MIYIRDIMIKRTTVVNNNKLKELIHKHLMSHESKKKKLEIYHTGKFLLFFDNLKIEEVREEPDFILSDGKDSIGLEHKIVVQEKSKKREGYFERIFELAETEINQDVELPNFYASCYIKSNTNFGKKDEKYLTELVVSVVKEYIFNNKLNENAIINKISLQPHSGKGIHANMGAWWVKYFTNDLLEKSIKAKESKVLNYREKSGIEEQWLLLIIDSGGESSFEMGKDLKLEFETKFNKIFVLEDFKNTLYELK